MKNSKTMVTVFVLCMIWLVACQETNTNLKPGEKTKIIQIEERKASSLVAYETWIVRWRSRYGEFHGDTQPESEIFTTKEDAIKFAKELGDAFKIIKHTSNTEISVSKQSN